MKMLKKLLLSITLLMVFSTPLMADNNRFPEMDISDPGKAMDLIREHLSTADNEFIKLIDTYTKAHIVDFVFLRNHTVSVLNGLASDHTELMTIAFVDLIKNTSNKTHEEFSQFATEKINMVGQLMTEEYKFNKHFILSDGQQTILWDFIEAYDENIIHRMEEKMSLIDTDIANKMMQLENPTEDDLAIILFEPFIGKTIKEIIN